MTEPDAAALAHAALAQRLSMTDQALREYEERMRREMQAHAAAVAEGYCPRCKGRLSVDPLGVHCAACDAYPGVTYKDGELTGTHFTSGWWKRGESR